MRTSSLAPAPVATPIRSTPAPGARAVPAAFHAKLAAITEATKQVLAGVQQLDATAPTVPPAARTVAEAAFDVVGQVLELQKMRGVSDDLKDTLTGAFVPLSEAGNDLISFAQYGTPVPASIVLAAAQLNVGRALNALLDCAAEAASS